MPSTFRLQSARNKQQRGKESNDRLWIKPEKGGMDWAEQGEKWDGERLPSGSEATVDEWLYRCAAEVDGCLNDDDGQEKFQQPGHGHKAVAQPEVVALADGVQLQGHQRERSPQRTGCEESRKVGQ